MSGNSSESSPVLSRSGKRVQEVNTTEPRSTRTGSNTSNSTSASNSTCISTSTSNSSSTSGSISFIKDIQMEEEFDILKTLAEGTYSKIYLAKRRVGGEKLVLKAVHCDLTTAEEFNREVNLTYYLSPHPNIVTCYNVSFIWDNCFVFVEEAAPFGPLSRFLRKGNSLPEKHVKVMAQQLASALDFIHEVKVVHGDVIPENILVYKSNLSRVKLSDFGSARSQGSLVVIKISSQSPPSRVTFAPPEICDLLPQEKYHCNTSADVWQMGILLFTCLTGSTPWDCADITDSAYRQYGLWVRRKSLKMPEPLKCFTLRFLRLFKRLVEPKSSNRSEVREVMKYLKDDWIRGRRVLTHSTSTGSHSASTTVKNKCYCNSVGKRHCGNGQWGTTTTTSDKENDTHFQLQSNSMDKKKVLEDWVNTTSHLCNTEAD